MRRWLLVLTAALALAAAGVSPAIAAPEDTANRISSEIMSPYCPGVTLHDCPSKEADALRERIKRWAAAGWSEDRIIDELVSQFGPSIRAVPPADGGGIAAWVVPGLVALAGAAFAGVLAKRWTAQREAEREAEDLAVRRSLRETTPEQRQRLAAELSAHRAHLAGGEPGAGA